MEAPSEGQHDSGPPRAVPRRRRRFRVLTLLLALLVALGLGEVAARIVTSRWPQRRIDVRTLATRSVGRFAAHDSLPYVLSRDYDDGAMRHNSDGFRGPPLRTQRADGATRVICLGASTTYGPLVKTEEAYPAVLQARLRADGYDCEVLNAGVPGWVSTDVLLDLELRILDLDPDVVTVMLGRNEMLPQCWNGYRPDYAHYRRDDYDFARVKSTHKRAFRISHLAMLLATWRGDRFGWSSRETNPVYGVIRYENQPGAPEVAENLADVSRGETFRKALATIVERCRARHIDVVLCTVAYVPEKLGTANLVVADGMHEPFARRVTANNEILRAVAQEHGVLVVETAELAQQRELFQDDCHVRAEGHGRRADMLLPVIRSLLDAR